MQDRLVNRWRVGRYVFEETERWGSEGTWFSYRLLAHDTQPFGEAHDNSYRFNSLEEAMAEAIADRALGGQGMAHGERVGTAAHWFMKMIGLK